MKPENIDKWIVYSLFAGIVLFFSISVAFYSLLAVIVMFFLISVMLVVLFHI